MAAAGWAVVEVVCFGCALCGLGFAATVAVVWGVVVVVAVVRGCEDEPQAAITRVMAAAASEAVVGRRRFLILLRRTPRGTITSRPPEAKATIILAVCISLS